MSKITFLDLLGAKTHFIVPTIQRDYAQGRNEGSDKSLCEEVRSDIVENLYNALTSANPTELVLDYVYGSDENDVFYPIDGQQRLTTLFLLHWYLGKKEQINISNSIKFDLLKKFTYEIRDTSKEFCQSLIEVDIDFSISDKISMQIKNSSKYHGSFNFDPTVNAMLVMLDKIDEKFRNQAMPMWDNLNRIKFWVLSLQQFGLTDDLFVKMNARGKRLSRFDVFKSDLESALSKGNYSDTSIIDLWKKEIDNTYLDKYWAEYGALNAEKNLFRTIVFFLKSYITNETDIVNDEWELKVSKVEYKDLINSIKTNIDTLKLVCNLLNSFNEWKSLMDDSNLFSMSNDDEKNILGYKKSEVFGVLYWFSKDGHNSIDSSFEQYHRILKNYIYSLRQADYKPMRRYSSSIDNKNVSKTYAVIKKIVDNYNDTDDFYDYIANSGYNEITFEIEKINSLQQGVSLTEIINLENLPLLGRNIHNFFANNCLLLNEAQINQITTNGNLLNKTLRIIYSYSSDTYGRFQDLLFDPIAIQSGKKQLYYNDIDDQATGYFHKYSFRSSDVFGDRILTSKGTNQYAEMSSCVRQYANEMKTKLDSGMNITDAINSLLSERLANVDFSDSANIKWYIVKYKEFFTSDSSTVISTLRRKVYGGIDIDNVYDIQCLQDGDNDFCMNHYQPFYLSLCHLLTNNRSRISIDENSLKYMGVEIEFAHPCTLSNGWIIRIVDDGNWTIKSNTGLPTIALPNFSVDALGVGHLDCTGCDSIEKMAEFIYNI